MDIFKKINYYGDDHHWSGSLGHADGANHGVNLEDCKFCGGSDQRISNTHTPYYSIYCDCGIKLEPCFVADDGTSYSDLDGCGGLIKSKDEAMELHQRALQHIVDKWNGNLPSDFYIYDDAESAEGVSAT